MSPVRGRVSVEINYRSHRKVVAGVLAVDLCHDDLGRLNFGGLVHQHPVDATSVGFLGLVTMKRIGRGMRERGLGGVMYFQIPTRVAIEMPEIKRWSFYPPTMWKRSKRWTRAWFRRFTGIGDDIRMNMLPAERVEQLLNSAGAKLLSTFDHPIGNDGESLIYVARKR